ncbi:class I SAM-dependent methyltransferase [Tenuifilum sp.]|uniref:class I SAM-dependent methyltransferase n=1 Tax=Tenuifilum sp. TaxID=2760880 RepID=UPI002B7DAB27|nr:class I SAM-dependent methyltransferase [Tenuifilum sp.]HOU74481.1 class I SAM-dependent methyltransferase [Tenuifilum sp.]HQE55687.1 class I SAM-dependent methyltransferase [Tenuifilum sp.]HQG72628.1 class I SAM-dependent methyltransferase [Tenuifilum sp.]HQI89800.1 class I SAM-dependent methyltransferase [Tenuifilum sp.]
MNNQETTAKFYDEFSDKQVKTGKNLRHYTLANILKKKGIGKANSVLEIGCGIGTLTDLLVSIAPKAVITAFDISPKNIEIAKGRIKSSRVKFMVSDASESISLNEKYDFVILADVIEHIPIERYNSLFSNLKQFSHTGTKIFINIPHPNLIKYLRETKPESLQIIYQSVYPTILYQHLSEQNFVIDEKVDYSIFYKTPDYTYYWLSLFSEKSNSNYSKTVPLPFRIFKKFILRVI